MVTVRKATRQDHDAVVSLWHCPSFKAMMENAAQDGLAPERPYLASAASSMVRRGNLFVMLDGPAVVGTLNRYGTPARPDIGWFVAEDRRRRGIAGEAVPAFVTMLFDEGAEAVGFGMFEANEASLRLAARLGLEPVPRREGEPEGVLRFTVTPEEWRERPGVPSSPRP